MFLERVAVGSLLEPSAAVRHRRSARFVRWSEKSLHHVHSLRDRADSLITGVDVLHADELVRALEGGIADEARRIRIVDVEDGEETVGDLGVRCVEVDFADVVAAGGPVDRLVRLDVKFLRRERSQSISREPSERGRTRRT